MIKEVKIILGLLFLSIVGMVVQNYRVVNFDNKLSITASQAPDIHADIVFNKVNDYRDSQGLSRLQWSNLLCPFATQRLNEIFTDFSHDKYAPELKKQPYYGLNQLYGENLAKGTFDDDSVVTRWIDSPEHHANIVNENFVSTCVAAQIHDSFTYFVQEFSSLPTNFVSNANTPVKNATVASLIDCTGPDGKQLRVTQKQCDDFNNAWKTKASNNATQQNGLAPGNVVCVLSYGTYQVTQAQCDQNKAYDHPGLNNYVSTYTEPTFNVPPPPAIQAPPSISAPQINYQPLQVPISSPITTPCTGVIWQGGVQVPVTVPCN